MKTRFSRRPRRISGRTKLLGAGLLAALAVLLLVRAMFPGTFFALAAPVWNLGTGITDAFAASRDAAQVRAERDRLLEEAETLRNEQAALRILLAEAGAPEPLGEGVVASVLARPPMAPYDMLVVGAGERHGIASGALVLARGVPVGRVASVSAASAQVRLFSAPGQESEAWAGEARLPVTLTGAGAGAFTARVPREASIEAGDLVYLPGPRPAGVVRAVERDVASPSALLRIAPYANVFSITVVRILPLP